MIRRPKSRLFPAAFQMVATMAALAGLVLETGQPKAAMASDLPATTAGVGLARVFEGDGLEMFEYRGGFMQVDGLAHGGRASEGGGFGRLGRLMGLSGPDSPAALSPQETAALCAAIWDIAGESDVTVASLRRDLGASEPDDPVANVAAAVSPGNATQVKWQRRG